MMNLLDHIFLIFQLSPIFIHPFHFGVWAVHFSLCSSTICLVGGPKEQNLMYYFLSSLTNARAELLPFLNKKNKTMEAKSAIGFTVGCRGLCSPGSARERTHRV